MIPKLGGFEVSERVNASLVPKVKATLMGLPRTLLFNERVVRACVSMVVVVGFQPS